ncbi:hypothetical protein Tco_0754359 [Tanacetum coccineum]
MENVNHDDEVPVVKPNQHNDVPVVPEPVLEDEDEDPKEEEFEEEEEDPQEEEDDMEIDLEEDVNEPELTCPYEETDFLNPSPPASESEPDNKIEVENSIEHEDETVPVSVYEVGESSTAAIPREDGDRLLPGFMRRYIDSSFCLKTAYALVEKKSEAKDKFYGKLILDLGNEVRSSVDQGTTTMERLVEKLGNVKEKAGARIRRIFLDGYGVLVFKTVIFKISSFKLQNARLLLKGKKVKFAAATLQGPSLTWLNAKVASMGLETMNQMS